MMNLKMNAMKEVVGDVAAILCRSNRPALKNFMAVENGDRSAMESEVFIKLAEKIQAYARESRDPFAELFSRESEEVIQKIKDFFLGDGSLGERESAKVKRKVVSMVVNSLTDSSTTAGYSNSGVGVRRGGATKKEAIRGVNTFSFSFDSLSERSDDNGTKTDVKTYELGLIFEDELPALNFVDYPVLSRLFSDGEASFKEADLSRIASSFLREKGEFEDPTSLADMKHKLIQSGVLTDFKDVDERIRSVAKELVHYTETVMGMSQEEIHEAASNGLFDEVFFRGRFWKSHDNYEKIKEENLNEVLNTRKQFLSLILQ